jgi:hypothetical protein
MGAKFYPSRCCELIGGRAAEAFAWRVLRLRMAGCGSWSLGSGL